MTESDSPITLRVQGPSDEDPARIAAATRQLRDELRSHDVDVAHPTLGESPAGAKGGGIDPFQMAELVLTAPSALVITLPALRGWLARRRSYSVVLEAHGDRLELRDLSSREQQTLVKEWLARRAGADTGGPAGLSGEAP